VALVGVAVVAVSASKPGIWEDIVAPWGWRFGFCQIKGTISRSGTRIYYLAGGRYYDRQTIDPALGERWFCSEGQARAAGWQGSPW
jgi:hypothetical protein